MRLIPLILLAGCALFSSDGVLDLRVPGEARIGEPVEVYLRAKGRGTAAVAASPSDSVPVGELSSSEFRIDGEQTLLWTFVPRSPGFHRVCVSMGGLSREATVRVLPRELRALYVERLPRFEWRFLKNSLIRDATLRVHCLLTSADPDWQQIHTPGFGDPPSTFPDDLSKYDVILMGDETPGEHLVRFVRERGGGLVIISGVNRWSGMPQVLLPVTVHGESKGEDLAPRATEAGRDFFPFEFSKEVKTLRWMLDATPKEGATVRAEAGGHPLFVTWTVGKGRVFWSATDETWLWRYLTGDEPYFYPLWRRAIEWAAWGR